MKAPRRLLLLLPFLLALVAAAPSSQSPAAFSLEGAPRQGALLFGTAPAGTATLLLDGEPIAMSPDGRFVIGLDRDHPGTATLSAHLHGGRTVSQTLAVAPRAWRVQHVNVARRPGGATAEYLRLRERELARINAARAVEAQSGGWRQRFIWPARGRISGVFGSQRVYRGEPASFHTGVDVAPGGGAPVVAPADGIVVLAGPPMFSLEGNLVILAHGMGLNSAFLHLGSVAVKEGQSVRQGQMIGTVGSTGRTTGPHLHWSLKWRDARIDPQVLAGPMTAG